MPQFTTRTPEETEALGERLAAVLRGGQTLAFTGDMGAGKTTFCRGVARGLGSIDPVQSPTFAIANYYRGRVPFAHFDAWRVRGEEDLETAGLYDYLQAGAVAAVEWSEKVAGLLDANAIRIHIAVLPGGGRRISIEGADGFE